jgi:uncharacterized protein (TIGR02246 family)
MSCLGAPLGPMETEMPSHRVEQLIEAADRANAAEDFDTLMNFYADDAILVVKPGNYARGKEEIWQAFVEIAEYFNHRLVVKQGKMIVIEGGGVALVISDTLLEFVEREGSRASLNRRATYIFRKEGGGDWLCAIDNSYGTELLMRG